MQICTQCGATSPPEATWCGSCYLLFGPPNAVPSAGPVIAAALPPVGADSVIPPQLSPATPAAQPTVAAVPPPPTVPQQATAPETPDPPAWGHAAPPQPLGWGSPAPAYAGWSVPTEPPVAQGWAPPSAPVPGQPAVEGRLLSRRALLIVSVSVGLGGLMQLAAYLLSRDASLNQDTLIRVDLVLTLTLYAVVATLLLSQITPKVKLRWGEGLLLGRMVNGAVLGLGLGLGLLALVSAANGHLSPDPRIVLLMSGGDPTHVVVVVLLSVVAAPLVEETLFRGLLLESLRTYGTPTAVIGSALFFAIWHFIPAAIIYYTALGAALGGLYIKRGLASSMTAHACFNGVLAVAAIVVVLGPGHTYDVSGLNVTAPSGWTPATKVDGPVLDALVLEGPDASGFTLNTILTATPFDPDQAAARLKTAAGPIAANTTIDPDSVRETQLSNVGTAVEADVSVGVNHGELLLFSAAGHDYVLVFVNGGSAKADADFTKMLDSLHPD